MSSFLIIGIAGLSISILTGVGVSLYYLGKSNKQEKTKPWCDEGLIDRDLSLEDVVNDLILLNNRNITIL